MVQDEVLAEKLRRRIDDKTKPIGSLGRLESLALQLGRIQGSVSPKVDKAALYVFAGDHGIARDGVSAYPQEVTQQMVLNFLNGGAAINVFARQAGMQLRVVDAGVASPLPFSTSLISRRVGAGTRSFLREPAMTAAQCEAALGMGAELMASAGAEGIQVIGFGEMGIGNTSSAAVLTSLCTGAPLNQCVGRGAGLDDAGLERKRRILSEALERHGAPGPPLDRLRVFGGFEIAMIAGAMMAAAARRMIILVDGFIVSAALAIAAEMRADLLEHCIFSHRSAEPGHDLLLRKFAAQPLLDLALRLGEGTGAALAYPLVRAAAAFLNEMATFEQANVSRRGSA